MVQGRRGRRPPHRTSTSSSRPPCLGSLRRGRPQPTLSSMRFAVCLLLAALPLTAATKDAPSRAADKGCKWEKLSDANLGLEAWVERCDYGYRKIDFLVKDKSLMQHYGDDGAPEAVVDVIDLQPGEKPEAGLKRGFAAPTKTEIATRCVIVPSKIDYP